MEATKSNPGKRALILFAHGSRDPEWTAPFRAVERTVSQLKPGITVELAFLEIMLPSLADVVDRLVASGHTRFTVAPLFMAQGAHLKRDLAEILAVVQHRHPQVEITLLPAAGEADSVVHAIGTWLAANV